MFTTLPVYNEQEMFQLEMTHSYTDSSQLSSASILSQTGPKIEC